MRNSKLPSPIVLGCFHKTGTNLLGKILRDLSKKELIDYWYYNTTTKRHGLPEPDNWDVRFDHHSLFLDEEYRIEVGEKILIVIRDPRDVIISAMHYHKKSDEQWLHIPRKEFEGLTYQEKINSLQNDEERLLFEMDHAASVTIKRMMKIHEFDSEIKLFKLEHLVNDIDLIYYDQFFCQIGLVDSSKSIAKEIAASHSLFNISNRDDKHVRSGAPEEWRKVYNKRLREEYSVRFGSIHEQLGYNPF